jgi:hypothetical protein
MADEHSGSPGAPTATPGRAARPGTQGNDEGSLGERAREAASEVQERAQDAVGQAKEQAEDVVGQAKEQAREAAGQARGQLRTQVDARSTEVGERAASSADDLHAVGDELRKQGKDAPARIADEVADRIERLGNYLERTDGETLLNDLEDLARRNPWPVALGGLAVGFAASRLLRASSHDRHRARSGSPNGGSAGALPRSTGTVRPPGGPPPTRVPPVDDRPGVGSAAPGRATPGGAATRSAGER